MHRFVNHCKKIGIPNPYSFKEIFDADKRWKKMQKFAVPPLGEFNAEGEKIQDNIKKRVFANTCRQDDGDFNI
jgi:hypothetical protein